VRIVGGSTPLYNCIAWSLGYADRWINPPQPLAAFQQLYIYHGHPVMWATDPQASIDGYSHFGGPMTHASRVSHANAPFWESKIGQAWRITHGRIGHLAGQDYGFIETSFEFDPPLVVNTGDVFEEPFLADEEINVVRGAAAGLDPELRQQYDQLLARWRESIGSPPLLLSSDTRDYGRHAEADALVALGEPALLLFLQTMAETDDGFLLLPLVERMMSWAQPTIPAPRRLESEQSRARAAVRRFASQSG
jgi:hypothetical protein